MKIIYASQTGNSEFYAKLLARMLYERGKDLTVHSIEYYSTAALVDEKEKVIFVCSTTGQGTVPSVMKRFWCSLLSLKMSMLPELHYTVFGLGDSSYEHYNFASKKLFRRLAQLKALAFCPRGEGDEQAAGGIDDGFFAWFNQLSKTLELSISMRPIIGPTVGITNAHESSSNDLIDRGSFKGIAVSNQRITSLDHFQDTRLVSIEIRDDLGYDAGDVAVIYPKNSNSSILSFCTRLKWDCSQCLHITELYPFVPVKAPKVATLRLLLSEYFDLLGPPNRCFFKLLAEFATDELQREKLKEIASPDGYDIYLDYCLRPRRTPLEILQDFYSVLTVPLEFVFDLLPVMKPRSFSIASYSEKKIDFCVALVKYKHPLIKAERVGLFSEFIREQLLPGTEIALSITKGDISVPEGSSPLILMAAGTGIAPMRALIQKYADQRKIYLFFGCRNVEKDFYFAQEWVQYRNLTVFAMGSRDRTQKVYLQDILNENAGLVFNLITKDGAMLVLAGNTKLPPQIKSALCRILSERGGFSPEMVKQFIEQMCKQGRFQIESW